MRCTRAVRGMAVVCAAVLLAGCADDRIFSAGGAADGPRPAFNVMTQVCETIDFDEFAHGDEITTVTALGMTLTVTGELWAQLSRPTLVPRVRAYDTDNIDGPDTDLEWQGTAPECPDCQGQGRVAVLEDARGFDDHGDDVWGGRIIFTGITQPVFVQSWKAFDNDEDEPPILLEVDDGAGDWTPLSESSQLGGGSVETVVSPLELLFGQAMRFTLGRAETFQQVRGSGAIDDIVLCTVPEQVGEEGCTLGYWKTHSSNAPGKQQDAWIPTGYTVSTELADVFVIPASLTDLNGDGKADTLYDALNFRGGPGVAGGARNLLRQAVAALLNAAHPDVAYALTQAQVIDQVNAALASLNRNTMLALAEELDRLNNEGCPLD